MLFLRFLLFVISFGFVGIAIAIVLYDVYLAFELDRLLRRTNDSPPRSSPTTSPASSDAEVQASAVPPPQTPGATYLRRRTGPRRAIRWAAAAKLLAIAAALSLFGKSILVVPDGHAAVLVSQISGVRPGTLYAGTHLVTPLVERAELYDIRDQVFSTAATDNTRDKTREVLTVEAREGLSVGVAVTVRYRLDPRHLDYIQANLPQPIDDQIVAPANLAPTTSSATSSPPSAKNFARRPPSSSPRAWPRIKSSSKKSCSVKSSSPKNILPASRACSSKNRKTIA